MSLKWLQYTVDAVYSAVPRRTPGRHALEQVRVVAHRGNTGTPGIAENTLEAFERCLELGVWGIELDVQWTRDGIPVVIHDPNTLRVFGEPAVVIGETGFDRLRRDCPGVPALEEVLPHLAGRAHLMLEIKTETLERRHLPTLRALLTDLEPAADYHLLCLQPDVFEGLSGFERGAMMPVAETNTRDIVIAAQRLGLSRIAGHYLLFHRRLRHDLRRRGIRYGVGFVPGGSLLRREIRLGSDWIFTNHAERLQHLLAHWRRPGND